MFEIQMLMKNVSAGKTVVAMLGGGAAIIRRTLTPMVLGLTPSTAADFPRRKNVNLSVKLLFTNLCFSLVKIKVAWLVELAYTGRS